VSAHVIDIEFWPRRNQTRRFLGFELQVLAREFEAINELSGKRNTGIEVFAPAPREISLQHIDEIVRATLVKAEHPLKWVGDDARKDHRYARELDTEIDPDGVPFKTVKYDLELDS
jgi:hypothetical protein